MYLATLNWFQCGNMNWKCVLFSFLRQRTNYISSWGHNYKDSNLVKPEFIFNLSTSVTITADHATTVIHIFEGFSWQNKLNLCFRRNILRWGSSPSVIESICPTCKCQIAGLLLLHSKKQFADFKWQMLCAAYTHIKENVLAF